MCEREGVRGSHSLFFSLLFSQVIFYLCARRYSLDVHVVLQVLIFLLIGGYLKRENLIFFIKRICHSLALRS